MFLRFLLLIPAILGPDLMLADLKTGFEKAKPGEIRELKTVAGVWTAAAGHAEVTAGYHYTGKQCLHIFGGKERMIEFTPATTIKLPGKLVFQAERWTSRNPFQFRIEERVKGKWVELFNGDRAVIVGRAFKSRVSIPLTRHPERLRFTCTSPERSGILIDDIALLPAGPAKIAEVTVEPVQVPVLIGQTANPLLRVRLDVTGSLKPIAFSNTQVSIGGTITDADLESVEWLSTGHSPNFTDPQPVAKAPGMKGGVIPLRGKHPLAEGANYFWLSVKLTDKANIDHTIRASCSVLNFSNGTAHKLQPIAPLTHRLGVAVRLGGQGGVHTSRIPGLATTPKGTLIAVYDLRHRSGGDLPGDIDVGMSRSTDGGQTWEPTRTIMDMGNDAKWHYDGIGDPAVLVDRNTGTIWVAATWSHGNRSWRGSGPGMKPEETGQFILVRSDDDGKTWSKPINITSQVKKPEWCFILAGPGKGITMADGTLVFAAQYQDPPNKRRLPHSTIIYSKDHGKTWTVGNGAFDDTTEAQVVEIEPGVLMLNCRYNRQSARVVMVTRDLGKTWTEHRTHRKALIEPRACMASLIGIDAERTGKPGPRLLFSNPNSLAARQRMTLKASPDRGNTWPEQSQLLLDQWRSAGYSCLSMIDDETVGILYEGSRAHMTFQRVKLADIGPDTRQASTGDAPPAFGRVFGSHMVLQQGRPIPVWGTAKPNDSVKVTLGGETKSSRANANGQWQLTFPARTASTKSHRLTAQTAGGRATLNDLLIGEVWLCAGQSNMEWKLSQSASAATAIPAAHHPRLRLCNWVGVARADGFIYSPGQIANLTPEKFFTGRWQRCQPATAAPFSAVSFFFGQKLDANIDAPIGLINVAVGGSPAEAWIARETLARHPKLSAMTQGLWLNNATLEPWCKGRSIHNLQRAAAAKETIPGDGLGPNHPFKPGFLWSAGAAPWTRLPIAGVLWYQGESNAESDWRVEQHDSVLSTLITDWRAQWNQPKLPFLFVQLPAMKRPHWPAFRASQQRVHDALPHTGMAVTVDLGHPTDVHPREKRPVGERLALIAAKQVYGKPVVACGPQIESVERKGARLVMSFKHAHGLQTQDGMMPAGFEVCDTEGRWKSAKVAIVAGKIEMALAENIRVVRYGWVPYPDPKLNLINAAGWPAAPFHWEIKL